MSQRCSSTCCCPRPRPVHRRVRNRDAPAGLKGLDPHLVAGTRPPRRKSRTVSVSPPCAVLRASAWKRSILVAGWQQALEISVADAACRHRFAHADHRTRQNTPGALPPEEDDRACSDGVVRGGSGRRIGSMPQSTAGHEQRSGECHQFHARDAPADLFGNQP